MRQNSQVAPAGSRPFALMDQSLYPAIVAAACAIDARDLTQCLAYALADGERPLRIRIWVLRADEAKPELIARYPRRGARKPDAPASVVRAALRDEPLHSGRSWLTALRADEAVIGVLEASARNGIDGEMLRALAPVVAGRLLALLHDEPAEDASPIMRLDEATERTEAVVATFAAEAKRLLDHDRLSVYLLTADGLSLERFAVATSPVIPGERDVIPLEHAGITRVVTGNRALVSDDLATDPRIQGAEDALIAAAGFHSVVSVPLRISAESIGALNFVSRNVGFYTEEDIAVAQQIADQVAVFFQNLRLGRRISLAIEREAIDHERSRLAHELHDTLLQSLANMSINLDLLSRSKTVEEEVRVQLQRLWEQAVGMADELRRSLLRLGPPQLDKVSLAEAMEIDLRELEREVGMKATFKFFGDPTTLATLVPSTQAAIFRIFHEATTNARKHSQGSRIAVTLRVNSEQILLSIGDDGVGSGSTSDSGLGLSSMRERAESIGGRLIITSTSGKGTSVSLTVPFVQEARGAPLDELPPGKLPEKKRVTRVLIVEDHPVFRKGLVDLLENEQDIRVVAQVGSAEEGAAAATRFRPDVVLLDVELSGESGVELARRLTQLEDPPSVLMLSAFPQPDYIASAVRAGALGYVAKTTSSPVLVDAIRTVANGATVFDSSSRAGLWTKQRAVELTPRELDVLRRVASGTTNSNIAGELSIAPKTVERIVATAASKLGAKNRAHAVATAMALNLFDHRLPEHRDS
jgi:signal transduction histidine kinase/DNA-binding NarL/FixJ family response regulator